MKHNLSFRNLCDLVLMPAYKPLETFMTSTQYYSCRDELSYPLPIILDSHVSYPVGTILDLQYDNLTVAQLAITECFEVDRHADAIKFFISSTTSNNNNIDSHPAVARWKEMGSYNLTGNLTILPTLAQFSSPHTSIESVAEQIQGYKYRIAFQTRNPIHKSHYYMLSLVKQRVSNNSDAIVCVHAVVGPTKDDDIDPETRIETYKVLDKKFAGEIPFFYLLYNMQMAGPRECLMHMLIRKNFGFTHMIVGRDHAGCKDSAGKDFYGPFDAQKLANEYSARIGIQVLAFDNIVCVGDNDTYSYMEEKDVPPNTQTNKISGTQFREMLRAGQEIPEWFAFPEVTEVLRKNIINS